ncbi:hypothetical protein E0H26_25245 [Micromonospora zingiberis]|uniref:Lipoprotein n=1 Tax=Micromonospora zingiberis TaxID=2053011 RepID=A0A4R0G657_9ACTN|nr:hypothetical protein [Micromonospora zingiberis]TCB91597.1 hypothetical protein E0H26_25245 [Micromonospora zingiberis]
MPSRKTLALVGVCALILSACSAEKDSAAENKLEAGALTAAEARLGDTIFAFYLSPQNNAKTFAGFKRNPAYVVLVQPDGSYRTVKTVGMDLGRLAWSDAGLSFADEEQDYLLRADGLTTVPSPKTDLQQSAFALPGGEGFVAVYNEGSPEEGRYTNQVVATTGAGSARYRVEGNYFTNALCDDTVYGISQQSGAHSAESASLPGLRSKADPQLEPEMLARLYPSPGDGQEKVIGWRSAFDTGPIVHHLPCEDGVITFLSAYQDADGLPHTAIVSWDTDTGKYVERRLVDDNGRPLDRTELEAISYDSGSLRDGKLEWFGPEGDIMATDVDTGATTRRFTTGYGPQGAQVAFTPDSIYTLGDPVDRQTPVTLKQFDRTTGETLTSFTLDGISERLSLSLVIRGVAVRPPA